MVVVLVIAVLVVGPKDLPRAIATIGKYIRKARAMAREFQSGINDLAREAELDDIKKDISSTDFNIKKQVEDAVDPTGSMQGMFNDIKPEIKDTPSGNGKAAVTASATATATATTPSGDNAEKGAAASADASPASKASSSTSDTSLKSSSETKAS
jgi:sec-independent protein translocase protein TatB